MNAAAETLAPATPAATRFQDNGDGTITDTQSGLMWSQATLCDEAVDHHRAGEICSALDLAGHTDWRPPTVEELFALADRTRQSPAIDTDAFPDTRSDWYWSATECAWASSSAWIVYFGGGSAYGYHRDDDGAFVRAVRAVPAGQ